MKIKEWAQTMKEWKMKSYQLRKKGTGQGTLPMPTTETEEPLGAPWDGTI